MGQPSRRTVAGGALKVALVPAAAMAVHQLRYLLAFGGSASLQLRETGHSYLHSLVPWIVLLIALAGGGFLWALGRALGGRRSPSARTLSFSVLWLTCFASLVAIFTVQELLEGLLLTGHPAGLAGIFGYGGWWAIPAAAGVGLVLAAILHGARCALDEVARRHLQPPFLPRLTVSAVCFLSPPLGRPRLVPLAGGWSDRGPPTR